MTGKYQLNRFLEDNQCFLRHADPIIRDWAAERIEAQYPDQAPRQAGPDTGPDENGVVQIVSDEFSYPGTSATIRVTITATESMMQ